jgi:hypothetical protein
MSELTGAWRLLDWTARSAGGEVSRPFGERPQGILVYTADGTMCSSFSRAGRAPLGVSLGEITAARCYWMGVDAGGQAPPAELHERFVAAALHFNSYAGRYWIDGDQVHHQVEVALYPDWIGKRLTRAWKLREERLALSFEAAGRMDTLEWVRRGP